MVFQGTAIPNLIIEVAGIMICLSALITIWYGSHRYIAAKRYLTGAFASMLVYNLCLLFLEFSQAARGNRWRTGVILVAFGTYLFPLIAAYIVSLFVAITVRDTREQYRWLKIVLTILMGIETAALIIAQITGNLVTADSEGRFYYGPAGAMGFMVTTSFIVIDLIMLLRLGHHYSKRKRAVLIAYLLLPILSIPLRSLWRGVYIVALASCISIMSMLILLVDEQARVLQQRERDNEQLKVDLMLSQIQPHFLFNVLYVIQEICCRAAN